MDEQTARGLLFLVSLILLIVLVGVIPNIINRYKAKVKEEANKVVISSLESEAKINAKGAVIEELKKTIAIKSQELATIQFEDWKKNELENHRKVIIEAALERAKSLLSEWKISEEKELRKDAITRSMGVNFGKITEHLIPFSSHLAEFDPRDVRFIGSPVDLMIFDGATQKRDYIDIYLVEIKTGSGVLSKKQKAIRDAISNNRVHWKPIVVPEFKWDVPDEDENDDVDEVPSPPY